MTTTSKAYPRNLSQVPSQRRRNGLVVTLSVLAGLALAVLWSFELVDSEIGDNVANTLLGHNAKGTSIAGTGAGLLFAFVSGLAGTFTACNIAMAASIGPLSTAGRRSGGHLSGTLGAVLRPLGWLTLGVVSVSAVYGFVGVLLGTRLPQLSNAVTSSGMPVRLVQSVVVFGVIGVALLYLGLAALGVLPDVFRDRPTARVLVLGALIGGFVIGRPFALFNKLFHWAAQTHNPFYGAGAFALQSLGNIAVVSAVFGLLTLLTRGRLLRVLTADPRRAALVSAVGLIALGVFTFVYWDVRVPAMFGFGWFPTMPYNH